MMKRLRLSDLSETALDALCLRNPLAEEEVVDTCREIFEDVERRGDDAVREWTLRLDRCSLEDFRVRPEEFEQARRVVPQQVLQALQRAARNIRTFHARQKEAEEPVEVQLGVACRRVSRPISPVGLYVPGGSAVLPSTVLMLGVPARLAGCRRVLMTVPPRPDGGVASEVLVAADVVGIDEIYKIGGAQAIAAMSVGTVTVPPVRKILGPGNRWVQAAKMLATWKGVAIDMVAGPSEVLVVADSGAAASLVAADLISQAEHGSDSRAILLTDSERLAGSVLSELSDQLEDLPRAPMAKEALEQSFVLLTESLDEALAFSNRYAPEHLILHLASPKDWLSRVESAGSVFLGKWSPEVAGDYASGTNHTLPTSGLAHAFSGVSLDSFVKKITVQELTREGLEGLAPTLEILAACEGLEGHRRAVALRLQEEREEENGNEEGEGTPWR